jgi:hypothetical protein
VLILLDFKSFRIRTYVSAETTGVSAGEKNVESADFGQTFQIGKTGFLGQMYGRAFLQRTYYHKVNICQDRFEP